MDWQAPCYQENPRLTAIGVIVKSSRCPFLNANVGIVKAIGASKVTTGTAKQEQAQPSKNKQEQARTSKNKQEQARTSKNKQEQATCHLLLVTICTGAITSFVYS